MTKQQIVVQLVAAKLAYNGINPWAKQIEEFGAVADMIIEMFPEPSVDDKKYYTFNNATVAGDPLVVSVEGMKQTFSTSVPEDYNA